MTKLVPFANDATSVSIGSLTVENGTDRGGGRRRRHHPLVSRP